MNILYPQTKLTPLKISKITIKNSKTFIKPYLKTLTKNPTKKTLNTIYHYFKTNT